MQALQDDPEKYAALKLFKNKTVLSKSLIVHKDLLGKGSNNKVFPALWKDEAVAFRMPRRQSDTQQKGSAKWEFIHTLKASQLGIAPKIYDAWYAKHASLQYPSGLYFVTEIFDADFEDMLLSKSKRETVIQNSDQIATSIFHCLKTLAENDILLYDLKPSNIVIDLNTFSAKIIDFGKDFCEFRNTKQPDSNTPIIDYLFNIVSSMNIERKKEFYEHILLAAMLVQLSATTSNFLYKDRHQHRMNEEERIQINGITRLTNRFVRDMQLRSLHVLRKILRQDNLKSVLQHYHGRRYCGTRRILRMATKQR